MNKNTENKKLEMENEILKIAADISAIRMNMSSVAKTYEAVIPIPIKKRINKLIDEAKSMCTALLSTFDGLEEDSIKQHRKYESVLIDNQMVAYKNELKILVGFPEKSKFNGYSVWINKSYFDKSIDGNEYQIRFYKDSLIKIHHYEKQAERFVSTDTKVISGEDFKNAFLVANTAVAPEESDDIQLEKTLPGLGEGIHY